MGRLTKRVKRGKLRKRARVKKNILIVTSIVVISGLVLQIIKGILFNLPILQDTECIEAEVIADARVDMHDVVKETDDVKTVEKVEDIILVNKDNPLDRSYVPTNLVVPEISFKNGSVNTKVDGVVATAIEDMFSAASTEGIILMGVSGYRSYDYQAELYSKEVKNKGYKYDSKYVAKKVKASINWGWL